MLAVLLALASAVGYGGSDFAAGLGARGASVLRVTLVAEGVTVIVAGLGLAVFGGHPPGLKTVAWGCAAGVGGVAGALALYLGFRHAEFSVAGPLSAVGAAGFSVLAGLLLGERPKALALAGIVLALPAIVGVSASARKRPADPDGGSALAARRSGRGPQWRVPHGVSYGLAAGACFALLFIGLNQAGSRSGLWPVFCSQVSGMATVTCVAAITRDLRLPGARGGWLGAAAGLTAAPATICFFLATHHGLLAVTAVISSLYPAVTITLARVLLGERLTVVRLAGLSLAAASVALIAASGAG